MFIKWYSMKKKIIEYLDSPINNEHFRGAYVSMALRMGDHRVGDTSGQLAKPQEMGLARRGFTSGASSPS